ncbi:MAG: FHA domain-containing protein [Candidatus Eremiobacteraeota bacterium]|nr:FHA domain-containing protein [Candidatus Eremiobacteraeota bacterium]
MSKTLQSQSQEQLTVQRRAAASKSRAARGCERCFARNEAGDTYCKVCGDQLPESLADVDSDATRRLVPAAARAQLIVELGNGGGTAEFWIEKDVALVGRSSPADGVDPDVDLGDVDPNRLVSRRHAFILRRRGGFAIEDLESVNGTYLNGIQRLQPHAQTLLRDGDQISFGETRAIFWTEAATGVTAQTPGLKVGH